MRMEDTKLTKCVIFRELMGAVGCVGGDEKKCIVCLLDDLRAFGINAEQWTVTAREEENGPRLRNKRRNVPCQNCLLRRKPGLDYGMKNYAQT